MPKANRTHYSLDAYAVPLAALQCNMGHHFCRLMLTDDFWNKIVPVYGAKALIAEPLGK